MKQFIVLLSCIPVLLVFLFAFTDCQVASSKICAVDDAVYAAKEMAKQEGCFTEEIRNWLKNEICSRIGGGLKASEIVIGSETDTSPVERIGFGKGDGIIHYKVSVPIGKRIYTVESYAPSEYLP